ncbi:hypothetical protein [Mesorhizobium sp. M0460]|uniref:hypothetical protein n=1 Tax=Mesorhizobium sp. M0460 TaxID=2956946 RepID=UPI003338F632
MAERADKTAFDIDEVCEAVGPALKDDWKEEKCDELMRAVQSFVGTDRQASIFDSEKVAGLETLRREMVGGYPLRRMVIDHIIRELSRGGFGPDAVCEGTANALKAQTGKGRYQIEEHYARESTAWRAANVGYRLDNVMSQYNFNALARELTGQSPVVTPARPVRHQGLDDGVAL